MNNVLPKDEYASYVDAVYRDGRATLRCASSSVGSAAMTTTRCDGSSTIKSCGTQERLNRASWGATGREGNLPPYSIAT
jgi:hypothetical protein